LIPIPIGLLGRPVAKDALRGAAAEVEDELVEAVAIPRGVLAFADDAHRPDLSGFSW
jgi:hypothetical protein